MNVEDKLIVASLKDVSGLPAATNSDVFSDVHPVSPNSSTVHNIDSDVDSDDNCISDDYDDSNLPRIAALKAAELKGPWFRGSIANASVNNSRLNIPIAADTFCPRNIISDKLAAAAGLEVRHCEGAIFGVGDGHLRFTGSVSGSVLIGSTTKVVEFSVSPDVEDFAFFSFPEQCRWGFVVDTVHGCITFDGDVVPYVRSKEMLRNCRLGSIKPDTSRSSKVVLAQSIVVPPSGSAEGFLTRGKIVDAPFDNDADVCFEPINLKSRYGMTGPRIVQKIGKEGYVAIVINNPFPVPIKLFRNALVGLAYEVDVDETDTKEMNDNPNSSPDEHPIDKLGKNVGCAGEEWTPERKKKVLEMLKRRHLAFSRGDMDVGKTDWMTFDIQLKPDCPGPVADAQRGYSIHKRGAIDEVVQGLLDKDFIEAASSAWRAFPVIARKKDPVTREWTGQRFCIDYRGLNAVTTKWNRLLCKVPEVLNAMGGASWFSTIDLVGAYHQVPMGEMSRPMTAFCVPGGRQYQWKVLPFGLSNAGACFSQLMEMVLSGLSYKSALAYLDDVLVWSATFEQHLKDVEAVLERLELAGLKAHPTKCSFFVKEVQVLGHVVNSQGVKPDPMKIEAVKQWPKPTDAKELVSFLAFANFYRRFINKFADIAHPLHKLTHNDVEWRWEQIHEDAFEKLKSVLCEEPVMTLPNLEKDWVLDTDWSRRGIAYVLQQYGDDGKLHPILYGSRSLSKSEQKYGSTRGEFLALFEGVTSCRHYLLGGNFTVRVDNKALVYLKSYRDLTHRTARALEMLADYGDFKIQYIPGKKNIPADALSRVPWKETTFTRVDISEVLAPMTTRSGHGGTEPAVEQPAEPRDWEKAQSKDLDIVQLKRWLSDGGRPPSTETTAFSPALKSYWATFAQFRIKEGIVHRVWTDGSGGPDSWLKLVPDQWRQRLLEGYHDENGHPGTKRLNATLRTRYYWFGMSLDATRHVETCGLCQVVKPNRVRAPLKQHPLGFVGQRVFWDIKGPLTETRRGNKYYLVIVDGFSKWTAVLPLVDIQATSVYQRFYDDWVCQNGCPVSLHSDRGTSLIGKVGQAVVDLLNVQQTTTVSHHQAANGQAETKVKASMAVIATILQEEDSLDWDLACPKTALAMNTTVNSVTGQTPWLIKHGQGEEALLPADLAVGNIPDDKQVDVVVRGLRDTQRRIFKKVVTATGGSLRRQKRNYDRLVAGPELKVGDLVRYEEHRVGEIDKSFMPKFRDVLFRVTEVLAEGVNYRLESVDLTEPVGFVTHYNLLKKVEQPRAPGEGPERPSRDKKKPARLEDYDLSDGSRQVV